MGTRRAETHSASRSTSKRQIPARFESPSRLRDLLPTTPLARLVCSCFHRRPIAASAGYPSTAGRAGWRYQRDIRRNAGATKHSGVVTITLSYLILRRAGDGTRTHDVQLGKRHENKDSIA